MATLMASYGYGSVHPTLFGIYIYIQYIYMHTIYICILYICAILIYIYIYIYIYIFIAMKHGHVGLASSRYRSIGLSKPGSSPYF